MAGSKTSPLRKFGKAVGEAFHARLADVWAARNVTELPLWIPVHERPETFLVPLTDNLVMVFESNHPADREKKPTTKINWQRVTRVQLLEVRVNG
jgi:hypothetical protein